MVVNSSRAGDIIASRRWRPWRTRSSTTTSWYVSTITRRRSSDVAGSQVASVEECELSPTSVGEESPRAEPRRAKRSRRRLSTGCPAQPARPEAPVHSPLPRPPSSIRSRPAKQGQTVRVDIGTGQADEPHQELVIAVPGSRGSSRMLSFASWRAAVPARPHLRRHPGAVTKLRMVPSHSSRALAPGARPVKSREICW